MDKKVFKILSIDGGGIRGVFPAHILKCMSERIEIRINEHFDMIAGTSTGSIIAAAVACQVNPAEIVNMYKEHGRAIFTKRKPRLLSKIRPVFCSLYDSAYLSKVLSDILGDIKLGEVPTPLLLPATDIGCGGVHVFKSCYSQDFTRDKYVLVRDAVVASCSAPTYFDPKRVDEYLLADGGLWANNPSLAAIIDAQYRLNIPLKDIRVFSLGTGLTKTLYGVMTGRKWGFMRAWRGKEFISFLMSLQGQATQNYLKLLLKENQILRLDFESERPLALDDCSAVGDLISRAGKMFSHNSTAIRDFIIEKETLP
jgi:patatin-like phospholipase/acyl hydrolase